MRFHLALVFLFTLSSFAVAEDDLVDFNRDIRPILSDNCFHCHGPDSSNQKSDYRMDTLEEAMREIDGYIGIVPGDLDESEVHYRIHSTDPIDVMPPPDSNRTMTAEEKALIDKWILQGAKYDKHWAYKQPTRVDSPKSKVSKDWAKNPIDDFIAAKLETEGLSPSKEADAPTLIRRAALASTGLLPKEEMLAKNLSYEDAVDELLSSMDYAERQTLIWLDAARFADTDGYQNDAERSNWPWRDWVIKSYKENMGFDQFTIQ
ncbi:MAG: DUF1549 domain-containing protein, partial [Verrucomicrobiota bacterium]